MVDPTRTIFIHGLEGSSQGVKATLLRELFPGLATPDFPGSLEERMDALSAVLEEGDRWTIIGSSFGGLMGALYTCQNPLKVRKLVLLAPALIWPDFAAQPPPPVDVPTVIYHGSRDELIPLDQVRRLAERVFEDLTFHAVDDDHGLYKTVHELDWDAVLS
jgi:pimeloyl-ACP methyl ester carboxylesterase